MLNKQTRNENKLRHEMRKTQLEFQQLDQHQQSQQASPNHSITVDYIKKLLQIIVELIILMLIMIIIVMMAVVFLQRNRDHTLPL